MDATQIITGHNVQEDPSGVGHAWQSIDLRDFPASIAEEIACWIIEDEPEPGAEMTASNGQHYRTAP
jgi:hypothetical protein